MGWVLGHGAHPMRVGKDDHMGLRIYEYMGGTYQFTEGKQPKGAVLVEVKQRVAPANKAKKQPANKGGRRADSGGAKRSGAATPGVSSATSK